MTNKQGRTLIEEMPWNDNLGRSNQFYSIKTVHLILMLLQIYSKNSTRTPMTRLPWLIRIRFWVPKNSFGSLRKLISDILGFFFLFYHELYVVCTQENRPIDAILKSLLNIIVQKV